jgi:hypothetical protein
MRGAVQDLEKEMKTGETTAGRNKNGAGFLSVGNAAFSVFPSLDLTALKFRNSTILYLY